MKLYIKRIAQAALITSAVAVAGSAFAMASSNIEDSKPVMFTNGGSSPLYVFSSNNAPHPLVPGASFSGVEVCSWDTKICTYPDFAHGSTNCNVSYKEGGSSISNDGCSQKPAPKPSPTPPAPVATQTQEVDLSYQVNGKDVDNNNLPTRIAEFKPDSYISISDNDGVEQDFIKKSWNDDSDFIHAGNIKSSSVIKVKNTSIDQFSCTASSRDANNLNGDGIQLPVDLKKESVKYAVTYKCWDNTLPQNPLKIPLSFSINGETQLDLTLSDFDSIKKSGLVTETGLFTQAKYNDYEDNTVDLMGSYYPWGVSSVKIKINTKKSVKLLDMAHNEYYCSWDAKADRNNSVESVMKSTQKSVKGFHFICKKHTPPPISVTVNYTGNPKSMSSISSGIMKLWGNDQVAVHEVPSSLSPEPVIDTKSVKEISKANLLQIKFNVNGVLVHTSYDLFFSNLNDYTMCQMMSGNDVGSDDGDILLQQGKMAYNISYKCN